MGKNKVYDTPTQRLLAENKRLSAENRWLKGALKFIYEECDWEEVTVNFSTYGDNRIGNVCSNFLGLKEKNK